MQKLHLDSEYRNRWETYHLFDGSTFDSRIINWRQVEWEKVIQVTANVVGRQHTVNMAGKPNFRFFMRFRWGGQEAQYDSDKKYIGHKQINIWTIGWSDGEKCYLRDIDFYDGKHIKDYVSPLSMFTQHIHPRVKDRCQLQ